MWVIGLVFAIQLLVVVWAVATRPTIGSAVASRLTAPPSLPADGSSAGAGVSPGFAVPGGGPAPAAVGDGSARGPASESLDSEFVLPTDPGDEVDMDGIKRRLATAAEGAATIEDPILSRLVDTGEELLLAGNMQGALQALAKAEPALPERPRVVANLAATYDGMGVHARALEYWNRILAMGRPISGDYHDIAYARVYGAPVDPVAALDPDAFPDQGAMESSGPVETAVGPASAPADPTLTIAEVKVDEQPPGQAGQRVSLRIVVESLDGRTHAGEDLDVFVFFYDLVDGDRILESTADTSYFYPSEPYDWAVSGREEIVVQYDQPKFTAEQEREFGSRRYHGYAIQLYYRDELQDTVEMPREIASLRLEPARAKVPPGTGSGPERMGPENALFPAPPR